jgi:hypothetical protein
MINVSDSLAFHSAQWLQCLFEGWRAGCQNCKGLERGVTCPLKHVRTNSSQLEERLWQRHGTPPYIN